MCWLFSYQVSHKTLSAPMTTDMAHYVVSLFYSTKLHRMSVVTVWGSRSLLSCLISTESSYNPPLRGGLTWSAGSLTCPGLIRLFWLISANIVSNCSGPSNCTQLRIVYDKQILEVYLNNISVEYPVLSKQQNVERTQCSN